MKLRFGQCLVTTNLFHRHGVPLGYYKDPWCDIPLAHSPLQLPEVRKPYVQDIAMT